MFNIGRGLALGGAAAADTAADQMIKNDAADHQAALEIKKASILNAVQEATANRTAATLHSNSVSPSYDPDTGRQLTYGEAAQYDPDTLTGATSAQQGSTVNPNYTIAGRPATNQQIQDNAEANRNIGLIQTAQQQRIADALAPSQDAGPPTSNDVQSANDAGAPTAEEQDIADSWQNDAGPLSNTKEAMLENRLANQKEMSDAKTAMMEKVAGISANAITASADLRYQAATQIANMKIASGNTAEILQGRLELQQAESQRKAAQGAAALLQKAGGIDAMDNDTRKNYNKLVELSGQEDFAPMSSISAADAKDQAKKEYNDKKHWYSGSVDGLSEKEYVDKRTRELTDPNKGAGGLLSTSSVAPPRNTPSPTASDFFDTKALPAGSTPTNQTTKDGRPVYKAPNGQLIAPKINTLKSH